MKLNVLYLTLSLFHIFSLYSMDSERKKIGQSISAPNSPYFRPQIPGKELRKFSLGEPISDQLALCSICESNYPAFLLLEHIRACKQSKEAALRAAAESGFLQVRKKPLRPSTHALPEQDPMDLD